MRMGSLLPCALAFALVTSAQCALPTTGGSRTTVGMTLEGEPPRGPNGRGWTIDLSLARARVAWVRLSEGASTASAAPRSVPFDPVRWRRALPSLGVAHAHPGHYTPGEALADATPLRVIDLLGPPVELGPAPAVTGTVRSASLALRPSPSGDDGLAPGASVQVEGTASREGAHVRFRARMEGGVDIEGAPVDGVIPEAPRARARVRIALGAWLARVDFAPLAGGDGATSDLRADAEADNAWSRGVRDGAAYRFELTTEDAR
jgi:hypothetical protein